MPQDSYGNPGMKKIKISFGSSIDKNEESEKMSGKDDYKNEDMGELVAKLKQVREYVKGDNKDDAIALLNECIGRYGKDEDMESDEKNMSLDEKLDRVMTRKG